MSAIRTPSWLRAAALCLPLLGVAAARAQDNVVLYTSNDQLAVQAVADVARKALPCVKLSAMTNGSVPLLKRMEAEAAKPQADIFWTGTANVMENDKALYEPYTSPQAGSIPAALHGPGKLWMAANAHVVLAMLNTKRLEGEPPKSWADLTDAKYKGKIIIADPANSTTAYTALWGIEQVLGSEGLRKIAANTAVSSAAANVVRAVGQGEFAVGITFESTAYPYVASGQKEIKLMYPRDGTSVAYDNMALVEGAPNAAAARKMYDLLLSKNLQIALLEAAFRRPSRTDIDISKYVEMPTLADIKVVPTDEHKAAVERDAFLARWQGFVAAGRK